MARYRKIYPLIWADDKFQELGQAEKLVALYVLTSEQTNRIGLFRFSKPAAAEDLGMALETFAERFANVCQGLGWSFDGVRRVLYIPSWWEWNSPENPNVLKSCLGDLEELPETKLIERFAENLEDLKPSLRKTFTERLGERLAKRRANQEQEQEQEQEQDSLSPARARVEDVPDETETVRQAALEAFDQWSHVSRSHGVKPEHNEHAKVFEMLDRVAAKPPIPLANGIVGQQAMVARAVECLKLDRKPFRTIAYAVGCVENKLEDWSREGMPPPNGRGHPGNGGSNGAARLPPGDARVQAILAEAKRKREAEEKEEVTHDAK